MANLFVNSRAPFALSLDGTGFDVMIPFNATSRSGLDATYVRPSETVGLVPPMPPLPPGQPMPPRKIGALDSTTEFDGNVMKVSFDETKATLRFDFAPLLDKLEAYEKTRDPIRMRNAVSQGANHQIEPVPGNLIGPEAVDTSPTQGAETAGRLIVLQINADRADGKSRVNSLSGWLLIKRGAVVKAGPPPATKP